MNHTSLTIVMILIYIYFIQYYKISCPQYFIDDLLNQRYFKTGDLICFKAYNHFNAVFTGCYFTHIGIVFIDPNDPNQTPMLFEASTPVNSNLRPYHNQYGIYCTPLKERLIKYKGRCFLKSLNKNLSINRINELKHFITYAIQNMQYDQHLFKSAFLKWIGYQNCNYNTNCGELVFLALLKLGLFDLSTFNNIKFPHHLHWLCYLKKINKTYQYNDLIEIIDHPFAR